MMTTTSCSHLSEDDKNTQMNFPYHTESISQLVHHFKPITIFGKKLIIFREGWEGRGGTPVAENSAKIINSIFEPFPNLVNKHTLLSRFV